MVKDLVNADMMVCSGANLISCMTYHIADIHSTSKELLEISGIKVMRVPCQFEYVATRLLLATLRLFWCRTLLHLGV